MQSHTVFVVVAAVFFSSFSLLIQSCAVCVYIINKMDKTKFKSGDRHSGQVKKKLLYSRANRISKLCVDFA